MRGGGEGEWREGGGSEWVSGGEGGMVEWGQVKGRRVGGKWDLA